MCKEPKGNNVSRGGGGSRQCFCCIIPKVVLAGVALVCEGGGIASQSGFLAPLDEASVPLLLEALPEEEPLKEAALVTLPPLV